MFIPVVGAMHGEQIFVNVDAILYIRPQPEAEDNTLIYFDRDHHITVKPSFPWVRKALEACTAAEPAPLSSRLGSLGEEAPTAE